jgi:signal transduction histidine kinase
MAPSPENSALRNEAEQRHVARDFSFQHGTQQVERRKGAGPDRGRLLHELQVRQLELEIQNESLVRANAKLEQSKASIESGPQRYAELYELAPLALFTLAPEGLVLNANQLGAARLTDAGMAAGPAASLRFAALLTDASLPAFDAFLTQLFAGPDSGKRNCEVRLRASQDDAGQVIELTGMARAGQTACDVAVVDITSRIQVHAEIEQLNKTLHLRVAQLAEANSELDAFSSSVAHDLQTPLSALESFLSLLERALLESNPAQVQHCVQRMAAVIEQMNQLTTGLLTLARIGHSELHLQTVNLSELSSEVIQNLRENEPLRQVTVHIQPGIHAQGDPLLLRQALSNLLGNAWKFTQHETQANIVFGAEEQADGEIFYFVRDNGVGFDMARARRLFDPFERLHPNTEYAGTGVGLATVKRIVARHGGHISAQAQPGQGATFRFSLGPPPEVRAIELVT